MGVGWGVLGVGWGGAWGLRGSLVLSWLLSWFCPRGRRIRGVNWRSY